MKSDTFGLESANWPALLITEQGVIRAASQGAKSVFGPTLENGASLRAIWAETARVEQTFANWQGGSLEIQSLKLRTKEGVVESFHALVCPANVGTERTFLLQLLRKSKSGSVEGANVQAEAAAHKQKLDCALQLTRTVALDFNNALTSILGHASLILGKMEPTHPWRSSLVEVEKSAEKAAEIAHDLAGFSRQDKEPQTHAAGNLNDLLRRTVELFRSHGKVEWELNFESRPYAAHFDEAKMQQAIAKILENAVQAIAESGKVKVGTRNIDVEEGLQDAGVRLAPGSYVRIEVTDTGSGISAEALPRIFEPFFTTKANPPHRGLGLAWVYGIVTNHGGSVTVASEVNRGTSVCVYLPAIKKFVKDRGVKGDDLSGTQTILMIDDEDLMLTMGQMVLSSFGYNVLTANSGNKGLELFKRHAKEIDLVITDLVMPQMSGREVIEKLRQLAPEVKIICASGFMRSSVAAEDDENYLQKPFTSQDLLRKVKGALSA